MNLYWPSPENNKKSRILKATNVVNVTGVNSTSIDGTEVPIDMWRFIDPDTIGVLFNLPDTTGVNGSGSLATIHFTVTGTVGDSSVLDISDGLLVDIWANTFIVVSINYCLLYRCNRFYRTAFPSYSPAGYWW